MLRCDEYHGKKFLADKELIIWPVYEYIWDIDFRERRYVRRRRETFLEKLDAKGRYERATTRIDRKFHDRRFVPERNLPKMKAPKKQKILHIIESSARRI